MVNDIWWIIINTVDVGWEFYFGLLKTSDGSIKFISRIKRKENDKKAENNKLKIERLK